MLKLTKTGIGLLTKQYRSVLRKCLLMNLCVLMCFCSRANASIEISYDATDIDYYGQSYSSIWYGHYTSTAHAIGHINLVTLGDLSNYYTKQEVNNIQSLNYYYTKTEADARYAKLSGGNTFGGRQDFYSLGGARTVSIWDYDASGIISVYNKNSDSPTVMVNGSSSSINMFDVMSSSTVPTTILSSSSFKLNGSSSATGIDFATNVTAGTTNASHLATTGAVNQLLNYYYTKTEADERYLINNSSAAGSIATGWSSSATGVYSVAIGPYSSVLSENSVAIGTWSYVSEDALWSVALGRSSAATEEKVFSIGDSDHNLFRRIVNVAEGSGAHDAVTVSQLGNIAAGTKILNANGERAITFGIESGQTTVGTAISNVANQLYNYYYTFRDDKTSEVIEFAEENDSLSLTEVCHA